MCHNSDTLCPVDGFQQSGTIVHQCNKKHESNSTSCPERNETDMYKCVGSRHIPPWQIPLGTFHPGIFPPGMFPPPDMFPP